MLDQSCSVVTLINAFNHDHRYFGNEWWLERFILTFSNSAGLKNPL